MMDNEGYSLIENLVALALLASILIPLFGIVIGISSNNVTNVKLNALMLAQSQIESYDSINAMKWPVTITEGQYTINKSRVTYEHYDQITVEVVWGEQGKRNIKLQNIVYRNDR